MNKTKTENRNRVKVINEKNGEIEKLKLEIKGIKSKGNACGSIES